MDEQNLNAAPERFPGEVVETYRRGPQEVVETYSRPLPGFAVERPQPPRKPKKTGLWVFLGCLSAAALLALGAWYLSLRDSGTRQQDQFEYHYDDQRGEETADAITIPVWPAGQGAELDVLRDHGDAMTAQEVYRLVNPAVVSVLARLEGETMSGGTGVIFSQDGYIVTNYHVLEGGRDCMVIMSNGYTCPALYVAGDAESDLAVLKVDETGLPAAEFGDSDQLTVGDPAYAIGNPLGLELRSTLTDGIISAVDRSVQVDGRTMTLIQTNAALNNGNSGGPLINEYGQVVGLNTIKMTSSRSNVEGLGFAIPSATMDLLVNEMLADGQVRQDPEPLLGVTVARVGVEVEPGVWGIEVLDVTKGSAGDLAGVQVGDFILSAGRAETASSRELLKVRRQYDVGDQMPMTLWRDSVRLEVTLELEKSVDDANPVPGSFFQLP